MSDEELQKIEERANAATLGPFETKVAYLGRKDANVCTADYGQVVAICPVRISPGGKFFHNRNAEFIAHARTDVPELIAEVRRLREEAAKTAAEAAARLNQDALADVSKLGQLLEQERGELKKIVDAGRAFSDALSYAPMPYDAIDARDKFRTLLHAREAKEAKP